jgi:hypothetical protein
MAAGEDGSGIVLAHLFAVCPSAQPRSVVFTLPFGLAFVEFCNVNALDFRFSNIEDWGEPKFYRVRSRR